MIATDSTKQRAASELCDKSEIAESRVQQKLIRTSTWESGSWYCNYCNSLTRFLARVTKHYTVLKTCYVVANNVKHSALSDLVPLMV